MKLTISHDRSHRSWVICIWECCGEKWEVIMSPTTVRQRQDFSPKCPHCHAEGKPFNPAGKE